MDKTVSQSRYRLGFVLASVYFEHEIDKTGVIQLDVKTYTCQEYKEELSK